MRCFTWSCMTFRLRVKSIWFSIMYSNREVSFLVTSFLLFHLAFLVFLGNSVALAPDELAYVFLFSDLYSQESTSDNFVGWTEGAEPIARIALLPAKIFNLAGLAELQSLRVLSILLCTAIFTQLIMKTRRNKFFVVRNYYWVVAVFFTPTVFVWTTLGLRECFIFFGLSTFFYFLHQNVQQITLISSAMLFISSLLLISVKFYIGLMVILSATLAFTIFALRKNKKKVIPKLLICWIIIFSPSFFYLEKISGITSPARYFVQQGVEKNDFADSARVTSEKLDLNMDAEPSQTITSLLYQTNSGGSKVNSWLVSTLRLDESDLGLSASGRFPDLSLDPGDVFRVVTYVFLAPFPFIDNGSPIRNLLSIEMPLWISFYILFFLLLIGYLKKRFVWDFTPLTIMIFLLIYASTLILVGSNLGTTVRHRSVLAIVILILLSQTKARQAPTGEKLAQPT